MKRFIYSTWGKDSRRKVEWVEVYLKPGERILDIGSGNGFVGEILNRRGFDVSLVDVKDWSARPELAPTVYDGRVLPFPSDSFETGLLLTVLHHTEDPALTISEALRVAGRVIIIEDIYTSSLGRRFVHFFDSFLNLEFSGHPHNNRDDEGWKDLFHSLGVTLADARYRKVGGLLTQATYCVER